MYTSPNTYFCNLKTKTLYVGIIIWPFCSHKYLIYSIHYSYLKNEKEITLLVHKCRYLMNALVWGVFNSYYQYSKKSCTEERNN